jgi:hypothetical protein
MFLKGEHFFKINFPISIMEEGGAGTKNISKSLKEFGESIRKHKLGGYVFLKFKLRSILIRSLNKNNVLGGLLQSLLFQSRRLRFENK